MKYPQLVNRYLQKEQSQHNKSNPNILIRVRESLAQHHIRSYRLNECRNAIPRRIYHHYRTPFQRLYQEEHHAGITENTVCEQTEPAIIRILFQGKIGKYFGYGNETN
jgi:hypothetical protein